MWKNSWRNGGWRSITPPSSGGSSNIAPSWRSTSHATSIRHFIGQKMDSCVVKPPNKRHVSKDGSLLPEGCAPAGPLGWPFLAPMSPSEPATAEDERRAERRADAPARSHRPKSTTLALRRGRACRACRCPCAAIDTASAGGISNVCANSGRVHSCLCRSTWNPSGPARAQSLPQQQRADHLGRKSLAPLGRAPPSALSVRGNRRAIAALLMQRGHPRSQRLDSNSTAQSTPRDGSSSPDSDGPPSSAPRPRRVHSPLAA